MNAKLNIEGAVGESVLAAQAKIFPHGRSFYEEAMPALNGSSKAIA